MVSTSFGFPGVAVEKDVKVGNNTQTSVVPADEAPQSAQATAAPTLSIKKTLKATEAYKNANVIEKIAIKKVAKKLDKIAADPAKVKEIEKLVAEKAMNAGDNQLVALLLVIFVGGLGIHRFYLGYTWQGVVQLLTAGGCGIWSLIDLIRIIMGTLEPKNGSYSKTL
jgi:TM2 domain-containing membrane protein YozV